MNGTNQLDGLGLAPRIIQHMFESISKASDCIEFGIKVGIVEVYMEQIRDLISNRQNLKLFEDAARGVFV